MCSRLGPVLASLQTPAEQVPFPGLSFSSLYELLLTLVPWKGCNWAARVLLTRPLWRESRGGWGFLPVVGLKTDAISEASWLSWLIGLVAEML